MLYPRPTSFRDPATGKCLPVPSGVLPPMAESSRLAVLGRPFGPDHGNRGCPDPKNLKPPRFGQEAALDPSNATILLIGGRVVSNYNIDINSHDENSGWDDATGHTGLMFTF